MPGHGAWALVERAVVGVTPARADGRLYDTGLGYPAACFAPATSTDGDNTTDAARVHGVVVVLDPAHASTTLRRLDRYEGPGYRRIALTLDDGTRAHAYDWIGPLRDLVAIESGQWPKPKPEDLPADQ